MGAIFRPWGCSWLVGFLSRWVEPLLVLKVEMMQCLCAPAGLCLPTKSADFFSRPICNIECCAVAPAGSISDNVQEIPYSLNAIHVDFVLNFAQMDQSFK